MRTLFNLYMDDTIIAKEMTLDTVLILIEAFELKFYNDSKMTLTIKSSTNDNNNSKSQEDMEFYNG